jgi:hypothetical protein
MTRIASVVLREPDQFSKIVRTHLVQCINILLLHYYMLTANGLGRSIVPSYFFPAGVSRQETNMRFKSVAPEKRSDTVCTKVYAYLSARRDSQFTISFCNIRHMSKYEIQGVKKVPSPHAVASRTQFHANFTFSCHQREPYQTNYHKNSRRNNHKMKYRVVKRDTALTVQTSVGFISMGL